MYSKEIKIDRLCTLFGINSGMVGKATFRDLLVQGRGGGKVSDKEMDLIFEMLDRSRDGVLERAEFGDLGRDDDTKRKRGENVKRGSSENINK